MIGSRSGLNALSWLANRLAGDSKASRRIPLLKVVQYLKESLNQMWVGADPGGAEKFGIALLFEDGRFSAESVSCADEAVEVVLRSSISPEGAGIDAPMWWSGGRSGDRTADQWLRKRHGIAAGTVQATNSLRGAALVQGALFAERLRRHFPALPITESHPKALLIALGLATDGRSQWREFCARYSVRGEYASEHDRDAVIGAVAAREGFAGRWRRDLAGNRSASEQDPSTYWLAPMRYFWPE